MAQVSFFDLIAQNSKGFTESEQKIAEYLLLVIWDILVANVQVAMIILFKRNEDIRSAWITVPLDVTSPEAITAFAEELAPYKSSKGAVQLPLDQPLPVDLITRVVQFRVDENLRKAAEKTGKRK